MGFAKILLLLTLTAPWIAQAQIYTCKDANGRTLTSDRPIMECMTRPMRELNNNGVVKREIPAPLTPEERQQIQLQEEKRKLAEAAAEIQRRQDQAIIDRYRNENDIYLARRRSLEVVEEQVKRENEWLQLAQVRLKEAQTELDPFQQQKLTPPIQLTRKYALAEQMVRERKQNIRDREAQMAQINAKYDVTLKRYRELLGATVMMK